MQTLLEQYQGTGKFLKVNIPYAFLFFLVQYIIVMFFNINSITWFTSLEV